MSSTPVSRAAARLLVVEDDEALRLAMKEGLADRGYAVTCATSAEEALEHLRASSYDLLITDYRLGGATGTWLARIAARSGQLASTRVLLVTGYTNVPDAEGLEVVQKPFDFEVLVAKVDQVLTAPNAEAPSDVAPPEQRIAFTLYVNDAPPSVRATQNLRAVVAAYRLDQIALTIVDITKHVDHRAEEDRIIVTPTLVKTFPAPRIWIVGDLERSEILDKILAQAGVDRATTSPSP